jgi:hypothetical protein
MISLQNPYAAVPSSLSVSLFGWNMAFVRPDEPVLYAEAVNIQNVSTTVAPLSPEDFFSLSRSYEDLQTYVPGEPATYSQNLDLSSGSIADVKIGLTQSNNQLLPGLYYAHITSPQMEGSNFYLVASSQVNLTFKLGATEALVWAVDLPSQTPVANAPITIYDDQGEPLGSGNR